MRYRDFLGYSRIIRYVLFFLTLILLIFTVKVYLNDFNLWNSISDEEKNQKDIDTQNSFEKNFYKRYLESNDSPFFMAHDNFIANKDNWEYIIKFETQEDAPADNKVTQETHDTSDEFVLNITNPKDAWNYYLWVKRKRFKSMF